MARVKIERVLESLDYDIKRCLEDVVRGGGTDRNDLYKKFLKAVERRCSTWVAVPDGCVETTCRQCGQNA